MVGRRWRLDVRERSKGPYYRLRTGRGRDRLAVSLGYMAQEEADRALACLNRDEEAGRGQRLLDWLEEDRPAAVRYLTGDPVSQARVQIAVDYRYYRLEDYFNEVYKDWRAEQNPGSWVQEERVWRRILPELGSTRLKDVGPHEVMDYLDGLIALRGPRNGQPASGNVKRLHRAALQALVKRAYRLRHIDSLPDLALFRLRGASRTVTDKPAPLSLKEVHVLMNASEPKFRAMWATAAGQGLRPAELSRIQWEDIDFQSKTLRVRGTKTEMSDALVPLTPLTRVELQRWWLHEGKPTTGLAFPSRAGGLYTSQGWKKALKNAAKAAGIQRRVYPYLLRDSFATIAWMQGIPLDLARRVMRHTAHSKMLEEVYCRPQPKDLAERLEEYQWVPNQGDG